MENIKLDANYNFLEDKGVYQDSLVDSVDLITKARSDNVISEKEASFLFKLAIKQEFKNEAKTITPLTNQAPEIRSFFMSMKNKQIKHV